MAEEQALACRKKILSRRRKIAIILALYTHLYFLKTPVRTSIRTGEIFTNEILNAHPRRVHEVLRMPITTFLDLRDWLEDRHLLRSSRGVTVEEQLMIFLWIVGHNGSNRDAQDLFQHSGETISRNFHNVLEALLHVYKEFVHVPPDIIPARIRSNWRKMSYFRDVRGAIDGTHILARLPAKESRPYRNRKGTITQNILAGCSLDMYFFYVCAGWEGSANDSRVLENAERHDFPYMDGRLWLADAGYGQRPGLLTPYKSVRYHLREQVLAGMEPRTKEELFNLRHAMLRNVIERVFGVLKQRFRILNTPLEYDIDTQSKLVMVLCALHNFIRHRANGAEDSFYHDADVERDQRFRSGSEQAFQEAESVEEDRSDGAALRDSMAEEMWVHYVQHREQRAQSGI
jgi:hypothetical protein